MNRREILRQKTNYYMNKLKLKLFSALITTIRKDDQGESFHAQKFISSHG